MAHVWYVFDGMANTCSYFAKKEEALQEAAEINEEYGWKGDDRAKPMKLEFTMTRAGIAELLNRWAGDL